MDVGAYGILNPLYIVASADTLWMADDAPASDLVYVLTASGHCVAQGIRTGNGPDEVLEVTSLHRVGNVTMLYDARRGVLGKLCRSGRSLQLQPLVRRVRMMDDVWLLPDSVRLLMPVMGGSSYVLADKAGQVLDSLVYYPEKPDVVPAFTHNLACTGPSAYAAAKGSLVRALAYDGGLDFFSVENHALSHMARREMFPMEYAVLDAGQPVPVPSSATRVGYSSPTASDDVFYALYSGALASEAGEGSDEIHAFEADGTPRCCYVLDRQVTALAVTPDNTVIHAVGAPTADNDDVCVYVYHLKEQTCYR